MHRALIVIAALALSGCAMSRETYLPHGRRGHSISCDGAMISMSQCLEKAGQICGSRGYQVFDRSGSVVPVGAISGSGGQFNGFMGGAITRNILIGCGNT